MAKPLSNVRLNATLPPLRVTYDPFRARRRDPQMDLS
jgi:hypothetical protein